MTSYYFTITQCSGLPQQSSDSRDCRIKVGNNFYNFRVIRGATLGERKEIQRRIMSGIAETLIITDGEIKAGLEAGLHVDVSVSAS